MIERIEYKGRIVTLACVLLVDEELKKVSKITRVGDVGMDYKIVFEDETSILASEYFVELH